MTPTEYNATKDQLGLTHEALAIPEGQIAVARLMRLIEYLGVDEAMDVLGLPRPKEESLPTVNDVRGILASGLKGGG